MSASSKHALPQDTVVPLHTHPARVVVVLSPSRMRIKNGDGKGAIAKRRAGEVFWSDPTEHSMEVIAGEAHEIEPELKQPPSPSRRTLRETCPICFRTWPASPSENPREFH